VNLPLVQTLVSWIITTMAVAGLPGLFALMAVESFGIPPLPSEVILPFAGFLIADGTYSATGALTAALIGGLAGSFIAYGVGRWARERLTTLGIGPFRLEARHLERMDRWFTVHGEATVIVSRLLPVVRGYISYPAGAARMNAARFGVYTFVGSFPFTVGLIYAGYLLRSDWSVVASYFNIANNVLLGLLAVALVYIILVLGGVIEFGWPPQRGPRWRKRASQGVTPP
jgi:membrane protein DedA with SNARE-associated domain